MGSGMPSNFTWWSTVNIWNWHLRKFQIFCVGVKLAQKLPQGISNDWGQSNCYKVLFSVTWFSSHGPPTEKRKISKFPFDFYTKERLFLYVWKIFVNLSRLKNGILSMKDCVLFLWKIAGFFNFERLRNLSYERLRNLSKLKNLQSFIETIRNLS